MKIQELILLIMAITMVGCQTDEKSVQYTIFTNNLLQGGPTMSTTETDDQNYTKSINEIKEFLRTEGNREILEKSLSWYAMETERPFSELNGMTGHQIVEYINRLKAEKLKSSS